MPEKALPKKTRTVIGVVEEVVLRGPASEAKLLARIDTGAERTTIDTDLAKAADRPETRDVMGATLVIAGKELEVHVAVTDRKDMNYPVIIGMDILRKSGFRVDPGKASGHGR